MLIGLIALLLASFGGAGASLLDAYWKEAESAVQDLVKDEKRRAAALEVLEKGRTEHKAQLEATIEARKELLAVDTEYASTQKDYDAAAKQLDEALLTGFDTAVDFRFLNRENLTQLEWVAVAERSAEKTNELTKDARKAWEAREKERLERARSRIGTTP